MQRPESLHGEGSGFSVKLVCICPGYVEDPLKNSSLFVFSNKIICSQSQECNMLLGKFQRNLSFKSDKRTSSLRFVARPCWLGCLL